MIRIDTNMALEKEKLAQDLAELEKELWEELKDKWGVSEEKIDALKKAWPNWHVTLSQQRRGKKTYPQLIFSSWETVEDGSKSDDDEKPQKRRKHKALLGIVRTEADREALEELFQKIRIARRLYDLIDLLP